ncbi:hypothetical protein HZA38_06370 [Candidatus Peregrinibacteria bacterium]|nr:hypothetical protein [Candidatus Peregrinibacteria bacterium]
MQKPEGEKSLTSSVQEKALEIYDWSKSMLVNLKNKIQEGREREEKKTKSIEIVGNVVEKFYSNQEKVRGMKTFEMQMNLFTLGAFLEVFQSLKKTGANIEITEEEIKKLEQVYQIGTSEEFKNVLQTAEKITDDDKRATELITSSPVTKMNTLLGENLSLINLNRKLQKSFERQGIYFDGYGHIELEGYQVQIWLFHPIEKIEETTLKNPYDLKALIPVKVVTLGKMLIPSPLFSEIEGQEGPFPLCGTINRHDMKIFLFQEGIQFSAEKTNIPYESQRELVFANETGNIIFDVIFPPEDYEYIRDPRTRLTILQLSEAYSDLTSLKAALATKNQNVISHEISEKLSKTNIAQYEYSRNFFFGVFSRSIKKRPLIFQDQPSDLSSSSALSDYLIQKWIPSHDEKFRQKYIGLILQACEKYLLDYIDNMKKLVEQNKPHETKGN